MKKVLLLMAAGLFVLLSGIDSADAQRRGSGFYRGGGGGGAAFRGAGFRGGFVRGAGIRRAGFIGGPAFRRAGFIGAPRFYGRRFVRGPAFWGPRRFIRRAAWIGAGVLPVAYYGRCHRWRLVATPWGLQRRLINVCYRHVYHRRAFYGGFYPGFYGPRAVYY